ncbi:MurR/RpiR family transcriptional regulator [Nitratireductor sp. ZSWI3]|uniref:MurR/RpiR family transcriptional regulator n=1 Tax=Nitratireductor sp. ZSWI3 TaxID=2966359 RepID=UPI00214F67D4|nr:MurR/RpiR family transcriptional regulator [Nitratireductor sp. ZSWI3]MCR4266344.1 MurR/RpiR family transcriptional regulator [Nitratireductor sp. ZSWI3]
MTASRPPRSIDELRDLVVSIRRQQSDILLGDKALDALAKLVDAPERAAVRTISELGELLSVNASTLTRLAKKLGFAGFSDFQSVFRAEIADDERYFYSRQAGRLLSTVPTGVEEVGVFERLARETAANVDGFMGQLDAGALHEAASLLAGAPRVRVHGVRQFHAFASFLTYGLGMLRSDVALLDAPRLGEAEALSQLSGGDVVVVASCEPYTRNVVDVAEAAAARGLDVVAITDMRASPLVAPSRHAFFVPHASSFFSNSMAAYIVFAEGLLNLVARVMGDAAVKALAEREKLIVDMRIETRGRP